MFTTASNSADLPPNMSYIAVGIDSIGEKFEFRPFKDFLITH